MTRLQHALERARAAIVARAGGAPCPIRAGGVLLHLDAPHFFDEHSPIEFFDNFPEVAESCVEKYTPRAVLDPECGSGGLPVVTYTLKGCKAETRPVKAPTPIVMVSVSEGLSWASCAAEEVRAGLELSAGAARVFDELHRLAVATSHMRGLRLRPDSVTFHLPAVILAALLGYSERHLYRLTGELRAAGVLDARGHVAQVGKLRRYSGTLWAVKLHPDAGRPRLRFWDFRHDWRPTFADEYHGEQGAWREVQAVLADVSEPFTYEGKQGRLQALALTWAAASRTPNSPAEGGSDMRAGAGLRGVARALPALIGLPSRRRHREVSRLAAELADALNERGRYRQWAGTIYAALTAESELRPGLEALALQVERMAVDLAEGAPWRRPGAVLASRLQP